MFTPQQARDMWWSLYTQHSDGPFTVYKQEVTLVLFEAALLDQDMRSACTLFLQLLAHSRTYPLNHGHLVSHITSLSDLAFTATTRKQEVAFFTALMSTPLPPDQEVVLKEVLPDVLALVSLSPTARWTQKLEHARVNTPAFEYIFSKVQDPGFYAASWLELRNFVMRDVPLSLSDDVSALLNTLHV